MKLKLDENGVVVLQDGLPVYIHDDGAEAPFDAAQAIRKIDALTEEKDRHWKAKDGLEKQLKAIDQRILEDPAAAVNALETVANLDVKKLVDAGQVETLKQSMGEAFESERKKLITDFTTKEEAANKKIASQHNTIVELMINSQFNKSPYFSGDNPLTTLTPDIAANHFGKYFRIEGEGSDAKVVGSINNTDILSRKNHGEPASFEEAMEVIIDKYPMKDRIMSAGHQGGHNSQGNRQGSANGKVVDRKDMKAFSANLEKIASGEVIAE